MPRHCDFADAGLGDWFDAPIIQLFCLAAIMEKFALVASTPIFHSVGSNLPTSQIEDFAMIICHHLANTKP
jgi:hypothetical protein